MMKIRLYLTLLFLALGVMLKAQPQFVALGAEKNIGDIVWQNPKSVSFSFENPGNSPLMITEVHPSCGCMKVDYSTTAVAPGTSGTIVVTYDAALLGTFYRELAVYTNVQQQPFYLSFQGRVVESMVDYEGDFPIDLGNVRLSGDYVEFNDVNRGDHPVVELQLVNTQNQTYRPQLMHLPHYLTAEYLPDEVRPGRVGKIRLTLNSERLFMDGLNQTSIYLARHMGDKISPKNEIVVSSVLLPAFRNLTSDQMKRAPHIVIMEDEEMVEDEVTFVMDGKKKLTKTFQVTNIGEETLSISAVQVFNRAVSVSLSNRNIAPHGTARLKISLDTKQLAKAKNGPRLLLISNDPRHAKTELNIGVEEE